MRVRNPEGKKRQLLDSALIEFAASGLAGTRTDAIAERAHCSAGLVYTYFGSKEALFDAVLDDITARTVEQMPITPDDLPGYAARLYEAGAAAPEIERFVAWYQLERDKGDSWRTAAADAMREKVAKVAAAQAAGVLSSRLSAAELVLTVQAVARMWFTQPKETIAVIDNGNRDPRDTIRAVVQALISLGKTGGCLAGRIRSVHRVGPASVCLLLPAALEDRHQRSAVAVPIRFVTATGRRPLRSAGPRPQDR